MKRIEIASPEALDAFRKQPKNDRIKCELHFAPNVPLPDKICPRCDGEIQVRRDSDGKRYTYDHWCPSCHWLASVDGGETLGYLLSEYNERQAREALEARRARERVAPETSCWENIGIPVFEQVEIGYSRFPDLGITSARSWRGVIDWLELPAAAFVENGEVLLDLAPVRAVSLTAADASLTAVLDAPATRRLSGLRVDLDREGHLAALLGAPELPLLRHLEIAGEAMRFDLTAIRALVDAPMMAALACFHASFEGCVDEGYDDVSYLSAQGRQMIALAESVPWLRTSISRLPTR
ncbi:MAG: hypothetical protein QM831_25325 [Kofleriaceae bacterium]